MSRFDPRTNKLSTEQKVQWPMNQMAKASSYSGEDRHACSDMAVTFQPTSIASTGKLPCLVFLLVSRVARPVAPPRDAVFEFPIIPDQKSQIT